MSSPHCCRVVVAAARRARQSAPPLPSSRVRPTPPRGRVVVVPAPPSRASVARRRVAGVSCPSVPAVRAGVGFCAPALSPCVCFSRHPLVGVCMRRCGVEPTSRGVGGGVSVGRSACTRARARGEATRAVGVNDVKEEEIVSMLDRFDADGDGARPRPFLFRRRAVPRGRWLLLFVVVRLLRDRPLTCFLAGRFDALSSSLRSPCPSPRITT